MTAKKCTKKAWGHVQSFVLFIKPITFLSFSLINSRRRRQQRERQNNNRCIKQNNRFARASRFFVHFFAVAAGNTTWKCLISRFMEDTNKRRRNFLSLPKLECGPQEINSKEIRLHFTFSVNWNKRDKVWKMLIHFKSDVFAAVAVVDAREFKKSLRRRQRERQKKQ